MAAGFTILNNRKRAIIALVHSIAFLALATRDLAVQARLPGVVGPLHPHIGHWILLGIYLIVSSVLLYLFWISNGTVERLYFGFCAASASSGFIRALIGDAAFPVGQYLRVSMLLCAVFTGVLLLRIHSEPARVPAEEMGD